MLPHNSLGRQMLTKLKVYAGPEHPHAAQQPQPVRDHPGRAVDARQLTERNRDDRTSSPIQTVGRRKEAIVRVRLLPGTGQFKLNGRTLEEYFPNKVHQQLIREPFVTLEKAEQYDVIGLAQGRRRHRPGRRAAPGHRPRADRDRGRGPSGR